MLEKLITLIKKALWMNGEDEIPVGEIMTSQVDLWESTYMDEGPWVDGEKVVSLGIPKIICQTMASQVLSEAEIKVEGESERARFLEEQLEKHLLPNLKEKIEKAMATGGMVFRPYIKGDGVCVDFCRQGQFIPLAFDDDGNMRDVAFGEQKVDGKTTYTRVERQTYNGEINLISNKAFMSNTKALGRPIPLEEVEDWKDIDEEVPFDYEGMLCGYYRVPIANNKDMDSPLGMSVFAPAMALIEKSDKQFSRLDWEYQGGQMAVDVNEDAIIDGELDNTSERLYRRIEANDDTYKVFNPSLRDVNYQSGLQEYKKNIEDIVGLSRGSISDPTSDVRTATEMRILKQRSYTTLKDNQSALENALIDLINAMAFLSVEYFGYDGEYHITINWNDSVLEDYQTELNRHLQLMDAEIESKVEVRMWAFGEDRETAIKKLQDIEDGFDEVYDGLENNGEVIESVVVDEE